MNGRWWIPWTLMTLICAASGCSDSDSKNSDSNGDSGNQSQLAWFTADCSTLGGVLSPKGACYIDCSDGKECPEGLVCGYGSAVHKYCKIPYQVCTQDTDCGPQGWDCYDQGSCILPCSEKMKEQSPECPEGMSCEGSFCIQGVSSPSTCPAGCRHPTDPSICCQPPFCTGNCSGSSCC